MKQELLQEAGLTGTEAKIYLALLEKGSCKAGEISRRAGIHRRNIYDALERLMHKGLVSYIKTNNRNYYEASNPEKLTAIIDEKQKRLEQIMPELQLKRTLSREKKETVFFRGKQAIKTIFQDQISTAEEIMVFGDAVNVNQIIKYYFPIFDKQRTEKGIRVRMIFDDSARKEEYLKKIPLSQIRFIRKGSTAPTSTNIYSDKISMIIWDENPKAILITEPALAESFKSYFEFIWRTAKK